MSDKVAGPSLHIHECDLKFKNISLKKVVRDLLDQEELLEVVVGSVF